jgi:hypothetical protein
MTEPRQDVSNNLSSTFLKYFRASVTNSVRTEFAARHRSYSNSATRQAALQREVRAKREALADPTRLL